jgi:hypothetical protein
VHLLVLVVDELVVRLLRPSGKQLSLALHIADVYQSRDFSRGVNRSGFGTKVAGSVLRFGLTDLFRIEIIGSLSCDWMRHSDTGKNGTDQVSLKCSLSSPRLCKIMRFVVIDLMVTSGIADLFQIHCYFSCVPDHGRERRITESGKMQGGSAAFSMFYISFADAACDRFVTSSIDPACLASLSGRRRTRAQRA